MNNAYPDKYRNSLLEMLQKGGVDVILDDSLVNELPGRHGMVTTLAGRQISADLVVSTLLAFLNKPIRILST